MLWTILRTLYVWSPLILTNISDRSHYRPASIDAKTQAERWGNLPIIVSGGENMQTQKVWLQCFSNAFEKKWGKVGSLGKGTTAGVEGRGPG